MKVACQGDSGSELIKLSPSSEAMETILPDVSPEPLTVASGSLWAGDGASVLRIDPDSDQLLATIRLSKWASGLAGNDEAVWALISRNGTDYLERIDTATNRVVATVPITGDLPNGASAERSTLDFEVGEGAAWILSIGWRGGIGGIISDGFVQRVDPQSGRITGVVPVGYSLDLTVGAGAVWAAFRGKGGVRIDARTLDVQTINVPGFEPFAVGDGGVWFLDREGPGVAVTRLDPHSLEVTASIPEPSFPSTVELDPVYDQDSHTIWIPDDNNQITRVDLT